MLLLWQFFKKKYLCDVSLKGVPEGHCFILTNNYTSKNYVIKLRL